MDILDRIVEALVAAGFSPISILLVGLLAVAIRQRVLLTEKRAQILWQWYVKFVPKEQRDEISDDGQQLKDD